jgi:glycine cleavage system H protein
MDHILYTRDHEWLRIGSDGVTIGVTDFAQQQLGDVVFVELPEVDTELAAGDEAAVIESVKAAGEITVPIDGKVVQINEGLVDQPDLINTAPESEGWIFKMIPAEEVVSADFMTHEEYRDYAQDEE